MTVVGIGHLVEHVNKLTRIVKKMVEDRTPEDIKPSNDRDQEHQTLHTYVQNHTSDTNHYLKNIYPLQLEKTAEGVSVLPEAAIEDKHTGESKDNPLNSDAFLILLDQAKSGDQANGNDEEMQKLKIALMNFTMPGMRLGKIEHYLTNDNIPNRAGMAAKAINTLLETKPDELPPKLFSLKHMDNSGLLPD